MFKIWLGNENSIIEYETKRSELISSDKYNTFLSMFSPSQKESILKIDGDTATITIDGMLTSRGPDFIDEILGLGGTGYNEILKSINEISKNENIKNVHFVMDSPGGEAIPVDEIWKAVFSLRESKNISATNQGQVVSAAYYIASAAHEIKAASNMVLTGSIGVVIISRKKSEFGNIVEVVSSNASNKRPDLNTSKGLAVLQERADAIERVFIKRISEGRGVSEDDIKENFGNGDIFVALDPDENKPDAISVGMIDGLIDSSIAIPVKKNNINLSEDDKTIIESVNEEQSPAGAGEIKQEVPKMSLKEFLAKNPDAQQEYNAAISAAEERGKKQIQDKVTAVAPFLRDENYKKAHGMAVDVLEDKKPLATFQGAIGFIDMDSESKNSTAAQEETTEVGDTPPDEAGAVDPNAAYEARKKRLQGGV